MFLSLLLASLDRFDDLLSRRNDFESALIDPKREIGYTHIFSETLGGAHSDALYPIGIADERYVIYFSEGSGGMLMFEKRHGMHANVDWYIPFRAVKRKHHVTGTIQKYLQSMGYELKPTPAASGIRRQLDKSGFFASYSYHPEMGGYASVIKPNGSTTPTHRNPNPISITPEEREFLTARRS